MHIPRRTVARHWSNPEQKSSVLVKTMKAKPNSHRSLSYERLPPWYQDNDWIRHGYRPVTNSMRACFTSWGYIHNETVNIYTHLIPAVLALLGQGALVLCFGRFYPMAPKQDYWLVFYYLGSISVCFGLSTLYHTLSCHSAWYSDIWSRIDYFGIMVLILANFVSGVYAAFYCEPDLMKTYFAMVGDVVRNFASWYQCLAWLIAARFTPHWYIWNGDGIHHNKSELPKPSVPLNPNPGLCFNGPFRIGSDYPRFDPVPT